MTTTLAAGFAGGVDGASYSFTVQSSSPPSTPKRPPHPDDTTPLVPIANATVCCSIPTAYGATRPKLSHQQRPRSAPLQPQRSARSGRPTSAPLHPQHRPAPQVPVTATHAAPKAPPKSSQLQSRPPDPTARRRSTTQSPRAAVASIPSPVHRAAPHVPTTVPLSIEAAWRARSQELRELNGMERRQAPLVERADPHARGDELLRHLKKLSDARAHANAMERNRIGVARMAMPAHSAQQAIDGLLRSARHQFDLRSPREAVRERALGAASARDAPSGHDSATAAQACESSRSTPDAVPAPCVATDQEEVAAHRPAPRMPVSFALEAERGTVEVPSKALESTLNPKVGSPDSSPLDDGREHTPNPHAFGSLTKRKSSSEMVSEKVAGRRTYNSWLSRADKLRKGITKSLGDGAADNFALTGNARMSGKVTSLNMISQGLVQQRELVKALKKQRCFRSANSVHLSMISTVARTRFHSRYSVIYREGAAAFTFYVLIRGALQHTSHEGVSEVVRVAAGDPMLCFGTEGVTGGMPRSTTTTCLETCEILHFATFRMRLNKEGAEEYARRAFATFVESEMQKMPIFFGMKPSMSVVLAAMFELRDCAVAGTFLFRPGEPSDALYILAKGRIVLEDAEGIEIAKMQAGSVEDGYPFFGESAILEGGVRSTYAVTRTPCKILVLRKCHFARVNRMMPNLQTRLQEFAKNRQSRADLARLAARDKKQRLAIERRAVARSVGLSPEDSEAQEAEAAATCVQKCWRGAHARGGGA